MTDAPESQPAMEAAIAWTVRVGDPAFDDWEAFEAWLAASPDHADAYHAAATAEAEMTAALATAPCPIEMPAPAPRRATPRRWMPFWGAAIAASLVGVIAYQAQGPALAPIVYETAPGVQRNVTLADGSSVILNGGTRLTADAGDPRMLTLASGEALFNVRHDAARPFSVTVGPARVVDIGTRFDIAREGDATRIEVSEGVVDWRRGGDAVRLDAGKRLQARDGSPDIALSAVAADAVGGWSDGQLSYDGAPLAEVAADLSRTIGVPVTVAPAIAQQKVRGVIRLDGGVAAVVPRVAALMGVRAHRDGPAWRLAALP